MDVTQPPLQRRLLVERATAARLVAGVDDPRRRFYDPGDRREHAGEERRIERARLRQSPIAFRARTKERARGASVDLGVTEPVLKERLIGELGLGVEAYFARL